MVNMPMLFFFGVCVQNFRCYAWRTSQQARNSLLLKEYVDAFHDKELSLMGISWLQKKIQEYNNKEFKLLSEIC